MNKSLGNAHTYGYATSNEESMREVVIEYSQTLWEMLLRKPGKKFVFVQPKPVRHTWYAKNSLEEVDYEWRVIIEQVIRLCERVGDK